MWPIVNMSEEDRATDMGSMHKKIGKDRACDSGDIIADRQTHRQTYSSQYFATAPEGELKIKCLILRCAYTDHAAHGRASALQSARSAVDKLLSGMCLSALYDGDDDRKFAECRMTFNPDRPSGAVLLHVIRAHRLRTPAAR